MTMKQYELSYLAMHKPICEHTLLGSTCLNEN